MKDSQLMPADPKKISGHEEAVKAYSQLIARGENVFGSLVARSELFGRMALIERALEDIQAAIVLQPLDADAWLKKGCLEVSSGKFADSIKSLRRALHLAPASVSAMFSLASAYQHIGSNHEAVNLYQAVLRFSPDHVAACSNLCTILIAHGHHTQAKVFAQRAVAAAPHFASALFNLALCHDALGETEDAEWIYRALLNIASDHEKAMVNLGTLLARSKRNNEAVGFYRKAIEIKPNWTLPKVNAALVLREMGQDHYAHDLISNVLHADPNHLLATLFHVVAALPAVAMDEGELRASRDLFASRLPAIQASLASATPEDIETAVGAIQPYYLAYHDDENRALLSAYGSIMVEAMSRFQAMVQRPAKTEGDRLTVGIVTAHARKHSVWDAITKGLVKQLDRERFRVVLFAVDPRDPCPSEVNADQGDVFVSGHGSLPQWINAISQQVPDVLIYPEVGMNHRVLQLAAMRLAPRQYAMWGHPETTGLSTIDGYFSGQAFEPDNADQYYVENLIRLPGTASFYEPVASMLDTQADPILPSDSRPRIVCPSAAFKFQPDNDWVFLDIVRANPTAKLVFFHMTLRWISERFESRLRKVFSDAGVDFDSHVAFEDWMSPNDFHRYLADSTVVIDTIGFSGYNTAIQAVEAGSPFVAYEGQFMRGRLGAGVLDTIDMDGFIAKDREHFVRIVTNLVHNDSLQQDARSRIAKNRHKLFEDRSVITAIEQELQNPSF